MAGADLSLKRGSHQATATFLASKSRSDDALAETDGLAGQAFYAYETKRVVFATQVEHYDTDFRMDTAFLNQTGVTQGWSFLAPSFYPDAKKNGWLKRVVPFVFTNYGKDRVQGGNKYLVLPGIRLHTTRQGFFRVDFGWGQEPWAGQSVSDPAGESVRRRADPAVAERLHARAPRALCLLRRRRSLLRQRRRT